MRTYTLKSIAQRGTMLSAAFAMMVSTALPALFPTLAFADALNPLTERSLTLSSSAPGWDFYDGSGNPTYSPPNAGANGQKVGNYFDFKVTTDTSAGTMEAMSFQYCKSPAGSCLAPGDNGWSGPTARNADTTTTSDLNVTVDTQQSQASIADDDPTDYATITDTSTATNPNGDFSSIPCSNDETPGVVGYQVGDCNAIAGKNFAVYYDDGGTWTEDPGWSMDAANFEIYNNAKTTGAVQNQATGKNNEIQLTHAGTGFDAGTRVRVVFFATDDNYITNPGSGAFFVRINTYNTTGAANLNSMTRYDEANIIDGGVTVANVMNLGIQIVTKVLETMAFSVGVVDPYTLEAEADDNGVTAGGADETSQFALAKGGTSYIHNVCEPILTRMVSNSGPHNRLSLGDPGAEYSLAVDKTYSTHSYFRLSSNSSAGATVYYSGNTLTNTVGDRINAIGDPEDDGTSTGTAANPSPGSEQFGLALAIDSTNPYGIDYRTETKPGYIYETGADLTDGNVAAGLATYPTQDIHSSVEDNAISDVDANLSWHEPQLATLTPAPQYANGAGYVNSVYNNNALTNNQYASDNTSFAFKPESMLVPVPIASNDSQVVDCVTGKARYIANIAATTPAGIYTTKINYIAAPQY